MRNVKKTSRIPGSIFNCVFFLIFLSCRSLTPVDKSAIQPQWDRFAVNGLDYFAGKMSNPRIQFHALRINLTDPQLMIVAAAGAAGVTAGNGETLSVKVSTFVRENNLEAGINALPFDPVSRKEGEPRAIVGIVISNGEMISPPHPPYDAIVFYAGGSAAIVAQSEIHSAGNIQNAAGGFFRILENGAPVPRVQGLEARHPRSAAGLSSDGEYLYLLAIDGRRPGSVGATEAETALLLKELGAAEGINLDGGGSTTLVLRYPDGKVRTVNTPVHGGIPGRERAVAGCLGVRIAGN